MHEEEKIHAFADVTMIDATTDARFPGSSGGRVRPRVIGFFNEGNSAEHEE